MVRLLGMVAAFSMSSSHVVTLECIVAILSHIIEQYVETLKNWTHTMKIILEGLFYNVARLSSVNNEVRE